MLTWLLERDFMPHGHCYFWRPDILWTHVISDSAIALAYFSIPLTLVYFIRKRPDVPFRGVLSLFASFIILCGTTHIFGVWTIWEPVYALDGAIKAMTAAVSLFTAIALIPLVPKALRLRSPAELEAAVALQQTEIRHHRETTNKLNHTLSLLTATLESTADGILVVDRQGKIVSFNRRFLEMWQIPDAVVASGDDERALATVLPQLDDPDGFLRKVRELYADASQESEEILQFKDGKVFERYSRPQRIDGEIVGRVWSFRDVTRGKIVEMELRRARDEALHASRAKSSFLANMSHEIRTPMNGVMGMTELALDTELEPHQREYLETVKSSADSLLGIINDILDFSKIEARKLDLDPIPFTLSHMVDETVRSFALIAARKGLELANRVSADVPSALVGDPGRVRQILANLLGNAIKFTENGEVVLQVARESGAEKRVVLHFTVSDTGIGIPLAKQAMIFDPFTQADASTTRRFGGTGLGLAIASQLVALMGGRIWVESQPGQGSRFHFTLPFERQSASLEAPPQRAVTDLLGLPVLVVDDNAMNREILREMLKQWGMQPTVVEGGAAALQSMERARDDGTPFAVVLLDYQMPDMDGFEVVEQIKRRPDLAASKVMMFTSVGRRGDALRCKELGVAAYLTKPVGKAVLMDAVLTVLAKPDQPMEPTQLVTRHTLRDTQRPLRILLVEDNAVNRLVALKMLEKCGHSMLLASNGRQAIEALERERFDVVLMDVQMPEMDGLEATAEIRRKEVGTGRHIPIVALTAYARQDDREHCLNAGMDAYLAKPFSADQLSGTLETLLPSSVARQRPAEVQADGGRIFDKAALLARLDGDESLFKEVIDLFQKDCPKLFADIQKAVQARSVKELAASAHALKGVLATVSASRAEGAARKLELLGKSGDLSRVESAQHDLAVEIEALITMLEAKA